MSGSNTRAYSSLPFAGGDCPGVSRREGLFSISTTIYQGIAIAGSAEILCVVHVGTLAHIPDCAAAFAAKAAFAVKAVFAAFAAKLKSKRHLLHLPCILYRLRLCPGCNIFHLRLVQQKFTTSTPGTPSNQFSVLNHAAHSVLAVTKHPCGLCHSTSSPLHPASDICVHAHSITHGQWPCSNISNNKKAARFSWRLSSLMGIFLS